ncbi:MAG: porin, partial [Desulfurobacteriaceae bacterium]
MRKALVFLTLLSLSLPASAQEVSNREILKKLRELEAKVERLEKENRELKKLLRREGFVYAGRERTESLKVDGRVLFRFSQSQELKEGEKTVYGDPGNGFTVRKARLKVHGKLNGNTGYTIHIRADRGSSVELWDAYITYSFDSLPLKVKAGQFKVPLSMIYLKSGTKLWLSERPVAVNKIAPVWRDVGIELSCGLMKDLTLSASVINGEGWSNGKIYNRDKNYAFTVAADARLLNTSVYFLRVRLGYEGGRDSSSKLVYNKYSVKGSSVSVRRNLVDLETEFSYKPYGISFAAGYLRDNPSHPEGKLSSPLGDAKGYYVQADFSLPFDRKFHLVGRYSWLDPNDA